MSKKKWFKIKKNKTHNNKFTSMYSSKNEVLMKSYWWLSLIYWNFDIRYRNYKILKKFIWLKE